MRPARTRLLLSSIRVLMERGKCHLRWRAAKITEEE